MAISKVQTGSGTSTSTTVTGTWNTGPTTAGNLLVAFVFTGAFASSLSAPSGWLSAKQQVNGSTNVCAMFYSMNAASQTSQAFAVPGNKSFVVMVEYAGAATTGALDSTGSGTSFSTTGTVSGTATTSANEVWVCGAGLLTTGLTLAGNNSFVSEVTATSGTVDQGAFFDKIVSATGTPSITVSWGGSSQTWLAVSASFIAAAVTVVQAAPLLFAYGQWPMGPMRSTQRQAIAPRYPHDTIGYAGGTPADHSTLSSAEYFFGERDPAIASDTPVVINNYGAWPLGPLRSTQLNGFQWHPHLNSTTVTDDGATKNCGVSENDLTLGNFTQFYGQVDQLQAFNQILPADSASASDSTAEVGSPAVTDSVSASDSTAEAGAIALVDAGSTSDSALLGGGPNASDSLSASDSTAESGALALPDSASASDSELSGGGPSSTDSVTASDLWSTLGLNGITDSGQVSDLLAWLGLLSFTDSGSLSDSTTFAYALILPADSVSASDSLALGGSDSLVDSVPASDGFGSGGSLGIPDSALLSDLLTSLGVDAFTDSGSISDLFSIVPVGGSGNIVITDQLLSLTDALSIVGALSLQDAVAVSSIETMVSYVVGVGTFKSRDGVGNLVSRNGVLALRSRDGSGKFVSRDGSGKLGSRDGTGSLHSR